MTTFIDSDTGFPLEVPCPGCGWPMYCCLCGSVFDDEDSKITQEKEVKIIAAIKGFACLVTHIFPVSWKSFLQNGKANG